MKAVKPSKAQAKLLARCWGANWYPHVSVNGYKDATTLACIKRGWLQPTNERGKYPNGDDYVAYGISPEGLTALWSVEWWP